MHQPAMSTSDADGADLGIRQNWMPLFYKYGVDFVLAGHDHDYERSYLVSGTDSGTVLRPHVVSTSKQAVDTDNGLVHLVIGTGGTKGHDDVYLTGTLPGPAARPYPYRGASRSVSTRLSGTKIQGKAHYPDIWSE
jgi:3',5'-cyclic AMP phosphodiesterase CpdA